MFLKISPLMKGLFIFLLFIGIFYNLWERPLFGVEGRWAEASREMSLRGSWFVPTINFEPHVTKPLIPFWLIKISGELLGYSEFSVRLPGALLALISLFLFYFLSKRFFEKEYALFGTMIFGVSLGFLQFARLAQSEIYQLFGIVFALTVYVYYREKSSFTGYILFILGLLFGALSKGLTTPAVLTLFVLIDTIIHRRYYHFNFKLLFALFIGIFLYFLPYYLTARELQTDLPFYLWFRENLKQAFNPYDNLRPFYIYFYFWPLWIFPFSLFLLTSLYDNTKKFKTLSNDELVFFLSNIAIVLLFTFAKARRGYYLLPILPFTVIMLIFYLKNFKNLLAVKFHQWLTYLLPFLNILTIIILKKKNYPLTYEIILALSLATIIQIILIVKLLKLQSFLEKLFFIGMLFLISEILYFSFLQPAYTSTSEKEAGLFIKKLYKINPNIKICSLSVEEKPVANFYFYAEIKKKIEDFKSSEEVLTQKCEVVVIRKVFKEEWKKLFQEKGFNLIKIETKSDKSKNYYIFYNSSTLKTPSF